jgi:hypothetical protein
VLGPRRVFDFSTLEHAIVLGICGFGGVVTSLADTLSY